MQPLSSPMEHSKSRLLLSTSPTLFMQALDPIKLYLRSTSSSLLPDKKKPTYLQLTNIIQDLCGDMSNVRFMFDFEQGAINAFAEVFLGNDVMLCFFHFTQNIFKNTSMKGFKKEYLEDPDFTKSKTII